jgi:predicted ATPase/DNA-binding SARP family transcriptional activator
MQESDTVGDLAFARPDALNIQLLGACRLVGDGQVSEPSNWRLRKAAHLVKLLALTADHRLHREQVFEYLWPDLDPAAAGNNLRVTLHFARRLLTQEGFPGAEALQIRGAHVVLFPDHPLWSDVEAFEVAAEAARGSDDPARFDVALALYSGDLLPEDRFEEWAIERRKQLRGACLDLLLEVAQLHEKRGDVIQSVRALQRVLELEPDHELAHVALIRLYARTGERVRALRQYQTLRETLSRELDVEPGPDATRLYELLLAGDVAAAGSLVGEARTTAPLARRMVPPLRHIPATTNLPLQLTSFVGRERELRALLDALKRSRLVTLIGPAGSGKTRLASEAAARLGKAYPEGVWLVDLAGLADPALVVPAIASALGVHDVPGRSLTRTLTDTLRDRRLLLLLDNCEHLIETCAAVAATLLRHCPALRVLTTSREPLRVDGEAVWPVPPLNLPDPRHESSLAGLRQAEALELFTERARLVSPGFALTESNAAAVVAICRRLEGIPLAIELAATRVRALSVEEIAGRLDDALGLLTAGNRDRPTRQQSLRAAIAWSYDLLPSEEQAVLRRLAVFASGFTVEAAEMVCASDGVRSGQVLDLLFRLIDKSLIVVEGRGDDVRYRLLETIRLFSWEQLGRTGEVNRIRERHRDWYLALGEQAEPGLVGTGTRDWMRRLSPEIDNIRVVLHWSVQQGDRETTLRLAASLWSFWLLSGRISEGREWFEPLLAEPAIDAVSETAHVRALGAAGHLAQRQGDYHHGVAWSEECLRRARAIDDRWSAAHALTNLCLCALYRGDVERTIELAHEGLALSREAGVMAGVPTSLSSLGLAEYWRGNLDAAREYLHDAVAAANEIGFTAFASWLLGHLADVVRAQGDRPAARLYAEESVAVGQEAGDAYGPALGRRELGRLAADAGRTDEAVELIGASLATFRALGYSQRMVECLEDLAALAVEQDAPVRALRLLAVAEHFREAEGCPMPPLRRRAIARAMERARATLGSAAFDTAWAVDRTMTLEQAVTYALAPHATGG